MRNLFILRRFGHLRLFEELIVTLGNNSCVTVVIEDKPNDLELPILQEFSNKYPDLKFEIVERTNDYLDLIRASFISLFNYNSAVLCKLNPDNLTFRRIKKSFLKTSPSLFLLNKLFSQSRLYLRTTQKICRFVGTYLKPSKQQLDILERFSPDRVIITPLVELETTQNQWLAACKYLGIPSIYAIHSWDNLTNKGFICVEPDRAFVWNHEQANELEMRHRYSALKVRIVGAPGYDKWFRRLKNRESIRFADIGSSKLSDSKKTVLYLGSSNSISGASELQLIIEISKELSKIDYQLLVRMHPQNFHVLDTTNFQNMDLVPSKPIIPFGQYSEDQYWKSISKSVAVVGMNTSGMIESLIFNKPVFSFNPKSISLTNPDFDHYKHIKNSKNIFQVSNVKELVEKVQKISHKDLNETSIFLQKFVRPQGLNAEATSFFIDSLNEPIEVKKIKISYSILAGLLAFSYFLIFEIDKLIFRMNKKIRLILNYNLNREILIKNLEEASFLIFTSKIIRHMFRRSFYRVKKKVLKILKIFTRKFSILLRKKIKFKNQIINYRYKSMRQKKFSLNSDFLTSSARVKQYDILWKNERIELLNQIEKQYGGKDLLIGPWISEVGYELLYWIPLLRKLKNLEIINFDNSLVVSRGGVNSWYADICDNYFEIFDLISLEEFRKFQENNYQISGTEKLYDDSILFTEFAKKFIPRNRHIELFSPSKMFAILQPLFAQKGRLSPYRMGFDLLDFGVINSEIFSTQRLDLMNEIGPYITIKFYQRPSFNLAGDEVTSLQKLLFDLSKKFTLVNLEQKKVFDKTHPSMSRILEGIDFIDATDLPIQSNLGLQTTLIKNADLHLGTYGGPSYIASMVGTPSFNFVSSGVGLNPVHEVFVKELARANATNTYILHSDVFTTFGRLL